MWVRWTVQSDSAVSFAKKRETHHLQTSYSLRKGTVCIFFKLVCKGHRHFTAKQLPYKPAKGLPTCWELRGWMESQKGWMDGCQARHGKKLLVLLLNKSKHVAMSSLHYRDFFCNYIPIRSFLFKCGGFLRSGQQRALPANYDEPGW